MDSSKDSPLLVDRIDAVLPQTQCRRCGYEGCRPYAEAIVEGAAINRCPPGSDALIVTLARITDRERIPLDRSCGEPGPLTVARIDEAACIGCTLCIAACPVDAIIGAAKRMHTVLAAYCSGCELCIPPCPVDCIEMVSAGRSWSTSDAVAARERYNARNKRHAVERKPNHPAVEAQPPKSEEQKRKAAIAAALERARARRAGSNAATTKSSSSQKP